jgi:hypothetical protein
LDPYYVDFAGLEMAPAGTPRRRASAHLRTAVGWAKPMGRANARPMACPPSPAPPGKISQGCVLYLETPRFAADRINAALGATAGILPDQPTLLQLPIRMARHPQGRWDR